MALILTDALKKDLLLDALASAVAGPHTGPLVGLLAILFTNDIPVTQDTELSELVQPAYAGYAPKAVTWGVPIKRTDDAWGVDSNLLTWQMGDSATTTDILGWGLITPGGSPVLMAVEKFDAVQGLVTADDALVFVGQYEQPDSAGSRATIIA